MQYYGAWSETALIVAVLSLALHYTLKNSHTLINF